MKLFYAKSKLPCDKAWFVLSCCGFCCILLTAVFIWIGFGEHYAKTEVRGTTHERSTPWVMVMIDDETIRRAGRFPFSRSYYGQFLRIANDQGARVVIFKLFFDQHADAAGDKEFSDAIRDSNAKVVLQAKCDPTEEHSNSLPERFYSDVEIPKSWRLLEGTFGWIPMNMLLENASDVGFADIENPNEFPLFIKYRKRMVKSIFLIAIEKAYNDKVNIDLDGKVTIAGVSIPVTDDGDVRITVEDDRYGEIVPLSRVLDGKVSPNTFMGKVVILGYDGSGGPTVNALQGNTIGAHRWFWGALCDFYRRHPYSDLPIDGASGRLPRK